MDAIVTFSVDKINSQYTCSKQEEVLLLCINPLHTNLDQENMPIDLYNYNL